jgi:hypothetical protein
MSRKIFGNIFGKKQTGGRQFGRKGFVYMIASVILVGILFSVILLRDDYSFTDKQMLEQRRIMVMNDFVKGFNQDMERAMQIASFRTMVALEDHVSTSGAYLDDTETRFRETAYYGTIEGNESTIMNESSLSDYLTRMRNISRRLGLNVTANITEIRLDQSDPWNLNVEADAEIEITDLTGLAYWTYNRTYQAKVPIYNLRDPLYSINTFNRLPNSIRASNFTYLVGAGNNTTNLVTHIETSYYLASNKSPNFIMRFENNFSSNANGIENIALLSDQDLDVYPDRIKVDYMYFNNISGTKVCNVQNVPATLKFVITTDRINMYNLSVGGLNYSLVCS